MIVASCPACRENVTVPIDARPTSIVRCPLCSAEYRLVEFLAQLPPPLIVVADAGVPTEEVPSPSTFGIGDAFGGQAAALDTGPVRDSSDTIPAFDFTPGSIDEDSPSPPRDSPRRPVRRPKNMAWEMAKIVGGALLAVPAAQIILWWFVPYDWKRDLLGIGPSISRVVPWVVPHKFRDTFGEDGFDSANIAAIDRQIVSPLKRPSVAAQDRPTLPPTRGSERAELPPPRLTSPPGISTAGDSAENRPSVTMPDPAEPRDGTPVAASDTAPSDTAPSDTGPAKTGPTVVAGDPSSRELAQAIPNAAWVPKYGAADLQVALEQALQASVDWDTSTDQTDSHRVSLADDFYGAFAHLGETLAFMRPNENHVRQWAAAVRDLLLSFGQQPKKLAMIGNRTADWLDQPTRPNQGVFLFGTVKQIEPGGPLFTTELELASLKKRTVTIVSRLDPEPFYAPGDRILMLGVLITLPTEQTAGSKDPASTVVLGSFPIRLPQ